jgi:hypothetical protein
MFTKTRTEDKFQERTGFSIFVRLRFKSNKGKKYKPFRNPQAKYPISAVPKPANYKYDEDITNLH